MRIRKAVALLGIRTLACLAGCVVMLCAASSDADASVRVHGRSASRSPASGHRQRRLRRLPARQRELVQLCRVPSYGELAAKIVGEPRGQLEKLGIIRALQGTREGHQVAGIAPGSCWMVWCARGLVL
jgi:hypothetical protein